MKNYCNLIGLQQWYFSLIWNILTSCNIYSNFKKFFADGDFCVIPNDPTYPECQNKVKVSRALKYYKQCGNNYLFIMYYLDLCSNYCPATYKSWAHVCNRAVVAGKNGWGPLRRESIETFTESWFPGLYVYHSLLVEKRTDDVDYYQDDYKTPKNCELKIYTTLLGPQPRKGEGHSLIWCNRYICCWCQCCFHGVESLGYTMKF